VNDNLRKPLSRTFTAPLAALLCQKASPPMRSMGQRMLRLRFLASDCDKIRSKSAQQSFRRLPGKHRFINIFCQDSNRRITHIKKPFLGNSDRPGGVFGLPAVKVVCYNLLVGSAGGSAGVRRR